MTTLSPIVNLTRINMAATAQILSSGFCLSEHWQVIVLIESSTLNVENTYLSDGANTVIHPCMSGANGES